MKEPGGNRDLHLWRPHTDGMQFWRWCWSQLNIASPVAQTVKNLPAVREIWVWCLGWEDLLEKGMATHSSILAWRIPWTEKPGGLQSSGVTANTSAFHFHLCCPLLLPKVSSTIHGSCEAHKTKAKQQWELQNLIPVLWLRFKTIVGFLTSFPARIPLASGHAPWVLWLAPHTPSPFNLKDSVSLLHPFYRWENWGT